MDSVLTTTVKPLHNVFVNMSPQSITENLYREVKRVFIPNCIMNLSPLLKLWSHFWANPKNVSINNVRIHKTLCFRSFLPEEIIHRKKNRIRAILNTAAETNNDVSTWAATKFWKHQEFAATYLCISKASKLFANLLLVWGGLLPKQLEVKPTLIFHHDPWKSTLHRVTESQNSLEWKWPPKIIQFSLSWEWKPGGDHPAALSRPATYRNSPEMGILQWPNPWGCSSEWLLSL